MKENVFRFEIAVQHIIFMHVLNSKTNLPHVFPHSPLRKPANFLKIMIKILPKTRLKDQISAILIDKEVIQPDDVRMVEEALNLDLSDELQNLVLVHLGAIDGFYGVDCCVSVASRDRKGSTVRGRPCRRFLSRCS